MVKCLDCGITGKIEDRKKFIQHGYPKESTIRLSCLNCQSENLKNTFWENFWYYLGYGILIILFSWIWIPVYIYLKFLRSNKDE